ncbi:hypothetical protein CUMW_242430 [Citrus unshiu]|uniref:Uncharacterized protein n=1 Tax=Citrus unshiu TaxID=55188 RepID=A0A2H5QLV6_CITUN|nr:hypothetical protein CUMW_242430 [Citrus unshiu]
MESKLYEAALAGSVTSLLEFLQKDRLILERAAMNCPSETPLHVAALLRHKDFAKEILRQKPGIAGELDSRKSSALHIASQKRYVGMKSNRIDVLEELVRARPLAASAPLIWVETILHLCVKHNQLEALKVLLENTDDSEFLNAKDDYGMSILHLAVADKQIEYYNQSECCYANGFTAWDILANSKRKMKDWEIGELLRRAGAISAKEMQQPATKVSITQTNSLTSHGNNQKKEGFLASLSIILLLISGLPLNRRIFISHKMENMERKLYEAAMAGSVNTLLELRQQDPLILERPTVNCLSETPLHVAALLGHEDFAKEILPQKPRIAEELDSRKSSALHIASQKGYVGIVKALLQVIPDKCSDTDVDGRNPLHLAAMRGHIDVLEELVRAKPDAASTRLIWVLLENMGDFELLNAKDDYGMTILHLAVADKQIEAIKFLTTSTAIEVNAVTANGFTAWDILAQSKRDIKDWDTGELLRRAGAISAKDLQLPVNELAVTHTNSVTSHENNQKHEGKKDLKGTPWNLDDWLEKKRNAAMVVASVISTMGFQAAVDPPQSPELAASSFVVWNTIAWIM